MNLKIVSATLLALAPAILHGQSATPSPDLSGVWGIYRGGPGSDPKFRPPAPSPLVLKPEYDKPYQADVLQRPRRRNGASNSTVAAHAAFLTVFPP